MNTLVTTTSISLSLIMFPFLSGYYITLVLFNDLFHVIVESNGPCKATIILCFSEGKVSIERFLSRFY